jgi:hypothetical protein
MKKIFSFGLSLSLLLAACGWAMNDQNTIDVTLPNTYTPSPIVGEWVNGYTSLTQIVDAYDGRYLGSTWQSGKYFKITENGTNSELYVLAKSQYSSFATRATGTIRFDEGSTSESGSFSFLALKAHYKGWGSSKVDRDATEIELKNNLSAKYYYRMENGWLRIQPGAEVNQYSSSFKKISEQ